MPFAAPDQIVRELSIDEGSQIADFGAGTGAFALPAARRAGSSGRVYAVDVQKDLLAKLKNEAAREGLSNVEIIWGNIEEPSGSKLAPHAVDRLIMANALFQAEDRERAVKEASRIMKPNGLLLFIDWADSFGGIGPKQEEVVAPSAARRLFLNNGFAEVKEVAAGSHHYGILFRKL